METVRSRGLVSRGRFSLTPLAARGVSRLLTRIQDKAEYKESMRYLLQRLRAAYAKGGIQAERMEQQLNGAVRVIIVVMMVIIIQHGRHPQGVDIPTPRAASRPSAWRSSSSAGSPSVGEALRLPQAWDDNPRIRSPVDALRSGNLGD
jgi:hypothetical protein